MQSESPATQGSTNVVGSGPHISSSTAGLTSSVNPTQSNAFFYPPGRPPGVVLDRYDTRNNTKTQEDQEFFSSGDYFHRSFLPNSMLATCLATMDLRIY
jgi:hypothetical protein